MRSVLQAGLLQLFGAIGGAVPFEVVGTLPAAGTAIIKADRRWALGRCYCGLALLLRRTALAGIKVTPGYCER